MAKVANLKSSIQSKIQQDVTSMKQKTASSTQATQAGSTVTPEVTSTPKVTQTAKAMPSITQRPEITPVSIQTPSVTQPNVRDLLWTTSLRKAATPDLLSRTTEEKDIRTTTLPLNLVRASIKSWWQVETTVNESLYQQWLDWINNKFWKLEEARKNITDTVWKTAIDMFKWVGEDLSTQWKEWKWLWATKDVVLNTIQWLPRWIARVEYWLSELLDWGIDAKRATNLKDSIKRDLDYWENTRTYKKVQETESFSDFLKNPLMYAWWTFTEMLPMFINAWVAVPTTYAQMYWDAYRDYAEDESLQDLTDNQIRLIATWVAWVNTIIELWADLVQGIMPWTKTVAKWTEKEVRHMLSKPISNLIRKVVRWWASEWAEEVLQNEIQTQVAIAGGSDRPAPTWWERFTLWLISSSIWAIFWWWDFTVNINRSKELKMAFDEWSEAVDNIAPWVSESDKKKLFSSIVAAEIQDANMSEKLVNKYETQTTELYNRIDELTKELETTTDETRKTEINRQIEDANQKIKNIDEIINSANKVTEEVTAKLQELSNQKEIEEIYESANKESYIDEWWKNLSEQTMRDTWIELWWWVKSYQTNTPEFKNWFKDSQVVDKEWNPLVVYHWTRHNITVPNMKRWKEFAYWAWMYFTTSKEWAQHYSESKKWLLDNFRKPRVMEVYLSIQNPIKEWEYRWDNKWIEELKNLWYNVNEEYLSREDVSVFDKYFNLIMMQGYKKLPKLMEDFSRITWYDWLMVEQPNWEQYWIAFRPEQVKSATDNIWTFDINDSNIKRDISYHLPSTWKDYESFAEALKQPQNDILKKLPISDLMKIEDWATRMRASATPELVKSLDFVRAAVQKELEERYNKDKKPEETKPAETIEEPSTFKDAQDYIDKMLDYEEKKAWRKLTDAERYMLTSKYSRNFLRKNIEWDFSKHMPWLKWVNLKQVEWELTDEMLTDIADMLALVSDTFWVDFNKLITDKNLSINVAQNVWAYLNSYGTIGIMLPKNTKDKLRELLISKWFSPALAEVRWEDIATAWVAISLKDWLQKAWETMAHELWHFIDFATSLEEWLPLRLVKDSSGTHIDYTSIIAKQRWWRTFNLFDVKKWDDYYNDPSEILARYAEQYFAYIHDNESFKELAYTKEWYWTPEEFEKLLPKFESLVRGRVWGKLLDKWNEFYYDVMNRIRDNKFARISAEFDRWWLFKTDVKQRIEFMKEEYAFIMSHINEMTWTLREEMETYVQLSNLQSNYEMAVAKGEEYLEKLNTTPEQQDIIDNITETVLPPEPVPWNPNPTPSDNPEVIRQWLPYFWWSNIEEGIGDIIKWWEWEKLWESYMKEEDIIKIRNRKNKIKGFFKECGQAFKDVFTPAISRIYNISPRVAWRLVTMETQKDINIFRYRQKAKWFVETLWGLKWNNALEVKMALLDYWALASEQGENIAEYKKDEVAKLKEVLLRNWFKEKDINDMFDVLNDIWRQYQDAWLKLVTTDLYFPRVVKDYEWLIDYMNRVSWKDIKVNKISLMMKIRNIQSDINLTDEEKEAKIRRAISIEFNQPWTTSQHWKERKMWKLSDWWEWIFAYYESPIESIDHYITTMVNAIQRQLFLWWMKEDADITEWDILNQSTAESVSTIIWKLVEQWKVSEDDIEELQKSILAVLNKKPSPKSVTALKDITYISTITNFLSAINQLDDLWMVILKDKSWLKHIVKTIAWRAWIKYNDLWLEDAYEMFREEWWITNWLFKKSFFNMFDRLGKTSFINAAWESMVHQAKNEKTRNYLYTRLQSMYWTESADRMMEKIDSNNYKDSDGQIDIEILRDLLYQLWSTQPIYTSAMPVTYLNHPWARLSYALSSFTLKRMDWLVQWFKEVNARHWKVAAWAWVMSVSFFLAMFWAAIWDIWDVLKWKKEDTFLWNLINKWIDEALAAWWSDMLDSWLKIWDLSEYDLKTLDRQWMQWLIGSKISPFIFDLGKDVIEAVWEHDANEITDLAKYVPIFWKLTYYWFWDELESVTKSEDDEWDFGWEEEWDFSWEEEWDFSWEEEWDFS